jgi:hypothetical protein
MHFRRYAGAALLLVVTTAGVFATPSHAQTAGDGFLFRVPHGSWGLRGGFDRAIAGGDVFAFVTKQLTLNRSDFSSATFGSNLAITMSATNDLVFDLSFATVSRGSEFRDWIDNNNQPITQTTSLRRIPLTIGMRHYLAPRGRAVGHFAWIPARQTTYVGFGIGYMAYRFRQIGDFVDFQTLNVFPDEFESKGWTPVLHANFGADFALGRFFLLNGEARYTWAHGPTGRDYVGFNKIDLSGLSATAGLSLRL